MRRGENGRDARKGGTFLLGVPQVEWKRIPQRGNTKGIGVAVIVEDEGVTRSGRECLKYTAKG